MSTAPTLHKFIIYAPDYSDAEAPARRNVARPAHLNRASQFIEAGKIKLGGAMLTPESIVGGEKKMVGSVLLLEAGSIEEAKEFVESDAYWSGDVWDKQKVVITPIALATPI